MDLHSSNLSPISISIKQPSQLCLNSWNDLLENTGLTIFDVAINQGGCKVSVSLRELHLPFMHFYCILFLVLFYSNN